jgi:hypothetical protein
MTEYALLIDNAFKEIRNYAEKPADIPHKKITWHPVTREVGVPYEGPRNGEWLIRVAEPAVEPPGVPRRVSQAQCRLFLSRNGMLATVEEAIRDHGGELLIEWEYRLDISRDHPAIPQIATLFNLNDEQIDGFFIAAAQL